MGSDRTIRARAMMRFNLPYALADNKSAGSPGHLAFFRLSTLALSVLEIRLKDRARFIMSRCRGRVLCLRQTVIAGVGLFLLRP